MNLITGLLTWSVVLLDFVTFGDIITVGTKETGVEISDPKQDDPGEPSHTQYIETVYMTNHCSQFVTGYRHDNSRLYVDSSIIVEATPDPRITTKTKCKVTFSARDPSERLILHFERMNINFRRRTEDKLRIYDGYDAQHQLTPSHGLYGRYSEHQHQQSMSIRDYVSSGQALTLLFVGELSLEFTGFKALLTVFKETDDLGHCPPTYMRCENTKRCIPQILRCNGYQNCGQDDLSDVADCHTSPSPSDNHARGFAYNADFGLMVGCAISIVILLVVVLWLGIVCIKRTKRYRAARRYHSPSSHMPAPHSDVDGAIVEPAAIHHVMAPPIAFLEPPPPYSAQPTATPASSLPRHQRQQRQLELPPPYTVDERDTAGLLINESPDGQCPPDQFPRQTPSPAPVNVVVSSPSHSAGSNNDTTNSPPTESGKEDIESAREAVDISQVVPTSPLDRVPGVECQSQLPPPVISNTPTETLLHLTGLTRGQRL